MFANVFYLGKNNFFWLDVTARHFPESDHILLNILNSKNIFMTKIHAFYAFCIV